MSEKIVAEGITFDDVLILPRYSTVVPSEVNTQTRITRSIDLNIPILSAAMDTVTESAMAIALAQEGGIGVIHRNLTIEDQAREVDIVKRSANGIILDPITMQPGQTIGQAKEIMAVNNISGLPIIADGKLVGILTNRDLRFQELVETQIDQIMTKTNLVTATPDTTLEAATKILHQEKVEKLLLVNEKGQLRGLITIKDINKMLQYPNSCRDQRGRLRVGAAVGPHEYERIEELIGKGVDLIVVDTAHGHSAGVIETVKKAKKKFDVDLIAGNVATAEGAQALIDAGADGIKVGIGPGSICTTRVVTGIGVPQVTAILECAKSAAAAGVPIIADGGIRYSCDIAKAIAAGAGAVMIGSLLAGVAESPGEMVLFKGRSYKTCRGMGSLGAMIEGGKTRYGQGDVGNEKLVPEGIEGRVPFKGGLDKFIYQLVGGLRSAMGYCGAATIEEFSTVTRFLKVSAATVAENHPHDIAITREAPNYWVEY